MEISGFLKCNTINKRYKIYSCLFRTCSLIYANRCNGATLHGSVCFQDVSRKWLPFPVGLLLKEPKRLLCSFLIIVLLCLAGKLWSEFNPTENPQDHVKITLASIKVEFWSNLYKRTVTKRWNRVSLILKKVSYFKINRIKLLHWIPDASLNQACFSKFNHVLTALLCSVKTHQLIYAITQQLLNSFN